MDTFGMPEVCPTGFRRECRMTRTVLIGGGAGALGSAVTAEFAAAGWRVVVPVRPGESAEDAVMVGADLTEPESVAEVMEVATAESGSPLRAVVNLVGGYASAGRVHETDIADFENQLRLNLRPAYLLTAAALPHLIAAGGGAIVCTSSRAAQRPFSGAAGYITSKAGVLAFVDALAVEYARDGIRVNAIVPNVIDTPANRASQPDSDRKGWTAPADIAKVVRYLCEDESATVTGAHLPV
jgi:NAD(P)-dependent dehydrogenase (short-subunit alcohol dehydrogenase family)